MTTGGLAAGGDPKVDRPGRSGGFWLTPSLPEVDPFNFAPRVTLPVLMLNGREDFTFPLASSQLPFFQALGAAAPAQQFDDAVMGDAVAGLHGRGGGRMITSGEVDRDLSSFQAL